jgi:hypothetical protein
MATGFDHVGRQHRHYFLDIPGVGFHSKGYRVSGKLFGHILEVCRQCHYHADNT